MFFENPSPTAKTEGFERKLFYTNFTRNFL